MEDIICVDGEIRTILKTIEEYLESMISNINSYNRQLKTVQQVGIKDELIRAKLGNLSTLLVSYKKTMAEILAKIKKDQNAFLADFEKNDTFDFPSGTIGEIDILLSLFS